MNPVYSPVQPGAPYGNPKNMAYTGRSGAQRLLVDIHVWWGEQGLVNEPLNPLIKGETGFPLGWECNSSTESAQ